MEWTKSPPELVARFEAASPKDPEVVRRPMFGYPALYLRGNMFASTFQDKIVVRLGDDLRRRAMEAGAVPFEPMPGRVMKGYVVVPPAIVESAAELSRWLADGCDHASTLPPKPPRTRRRSS